MKFINKKIYIYNYYQELQGFVQKILTNGLMIVNYENEMRTTVY